MDLQNFLTSLGIRNTYINLTVKTPRAQQCRIQNIRSVGSSQNDNALCPAKTVHFNQQLVECLFPFVLTATKTSTTLMSSRRIAEVSEAYGDAGRVLVRYSGTEPKCRVMLEGPDLAVLQRDAQSIADLIAKETSN